MLPDGHAHSWEVLGKTFSQVLQERVFISAILKDIGQVSIEGNRQYHVFACKQQYVSP